MGSVKPFEIKKKNLFEASFLLFPPFFLLLLLLKKKKNNSSLVIGSKEESISPVRSHKFTKETHFPGWNY